MDTLSALFAHLAAEPHLQLSKTSHQSSFLLTTTGLVPAPEVRYVFNFGLWKKAPHRFLIQEQVNGVIILRLRQPLMLTPTTTLAEIREAEDATAIDLAIWATQSGGLRIVYKADVELNPASYSLYSAEEIDLLGQLYADVMSWIAGRFAPMPTT